MQMPSSHSTNNDPFMFNGDMMIMPKALASIAPLEKQTPYANQYNLGMTHERKAFNELLQKVFKKKVFLWSMDKTFNKEGEYIVAVFYSELKEDSLQTGSEQTVTVGNINPQHFSPKSEEKEDALLNEFVLSLQKIREDSDSEDNPFQ